MAQVGPDIKTLFDPEILGDYRDAITGKLAGHVIMNKCDYLKYIKPATTFLNLYKLIDGTKELCTGVIPYAKDCLTACVIGDKQCEKYNALFLVVPDTRVTVGFVIVEKGECKEKPNTVSIKLICSSFRGGGHILLGAVAYCIKASEFDKEIILDLAGGKLNDRALKSYERFGFVDSEHLRLGNCYPTGKGNLIMLLDLNLWKSKYNVQGVLDERTEPTNLHVSEEPTKLHVSEEPTNPYVSEEPPSGIKRYRNETKNENRGRGGKRKTRRRTRYRRKN